MHDGKIGGRRIESLGRDDPPADFAESDSITGALCPAGDNEIIAVLEPLPGLTTGQRKRISAAPCQLEHAAARIVCRPANRAAREQIASLKIATVDRVMRQLLRNAPVQILEI